MIICKHTLYLLSKDNKLRHIPLECEETYNNNRELDDREILEVNSKSSYDNTNFYSPNPDYYPPSFRSANSDMPSSTSNGIINNNQQNKNPKQIAKKWNYNLPEDQITTNENHQTTNNAGNQRPKGNNQDYGVVIDAVTDTRRRPMYRRYLYVLSQSDALKRIGKKFCESYFCDYATQETQDKGKDVNQIANQTTAPSSKNDMTLSSRQRRRSARLQDKEHQRQKNLADKNYQKMLECLSEMTKNFNDEINYTVEYKKVYENYVRNNYKNFRAMVKAGAPSHCFVQTSAGKNDDHQKRKNRNNNNNHNKDNNDATEIDELKWYIPENPKLREHRIDFIKNMKTWDRYGNALAGDSIEVFDENKHDRGRIFNMSFNESMRFCSLKVCQSPAKLSDTLDQNQIEDIIRRADRRPTEPGWDQNRLLTVQDVHGKLYQLGINEFHLAHLGNEGLQVTLENLVDINENLDLNRDNDSFEIYETTELSDDDENNMVDVQLSDVIKNKNKHLMKNNSDNLKIIQKKSVTTRKRKTREPISIEDSNSVFKSILIHNRLPSKDKIRQIFLKKYGQRHITKVIVGDSALGYLTNYGEFFISCATRKTYESIFGVPFYKAKLSRMNRLHMNYKDIKKPICVNMEYFFKESSFWKQLHRRVLNRTEKNLGKHQIFDDDIYKELPFFVSASIGNEHLAFIDRNNRVYVMGKNTFGQLGVEDKLPCYRPKEIFENQLVRFVYCGYNHIMACVEKRDKARALLKVSLYGAGEIRYDDEILLGFQYTFVEPSYVVWRNSKF